MTSKGQLTVPKEIRDQLGLAPGDKVELVLSGGGRHVDHAQAAGGRALDELLGSLPTNGVTATLEEMERGPRRRHCRESVLRR